MFSIGSKIFYPNYGAGVVHSIEEKEVLGERKKYYILHMVISQIDIMIPIDNINKLGIRHVIEKNQVDEIIERLKDEKGNMDEKWNKRYRDNMEKIKTGDINEIANVVRDLILQDKEKSLSTGEKKMLNDSKDMLISELMLVLDSEKEEIKNMIGKCLDID